MGHYIQRQEIKFCMTDSALSALGDDRLLSLPLAVDVSVGV